MKTATIIPAARMPAAQGGRLTYAVPDAFVQTLTRGMIVEIPLRLRHIMGVVEEIADGTPTGFRLRSISKILWPQPVVTPQLFALAEYTSSYYLVPIGVVIKAMITRPAPRAVARDQTPSRSLKGATENITLTAEQASAVAAILAQRNQAQTFLLHGVTGSGKTEVYLRVAQKILEHKKQILVLVPEIALTPQTLDRFTTRFPDAKIAVVHSRLSYGQKYLIWKGAFDGSVDIVIGPRSAIFAPFRSLGLITIDEEHDASYKQADQQPKFHTETLAVKLSQLWRCPLILGDATPAITTYYESEHGTIKRLTLSTRIHQPLPHVTLVDMREEARAGNFSIFSQALIQSMSAILERKQQVILFLNRRGTATSLQCRDCGHVVYCERCTVTVVYHADRELLECHHCGRTYQLPTLCPHCQSPRLALIGSGTEKIEAQIKKIFPAAKIRRLDRDTISKKNELQSLYEDFAAQKFHVLVGTQLLAKGWDFVHVGLIGVINADTAMALPDFRSNERTFQLITQVAGRTGRGREPGEVIVQTYTPKNPGLAAAVQHDYRSFYEREIADRKEFFYPPYSKLIKITTRHTRLEKAAREAEELKQKMLGSGLAPELSIGPTPAFIARTRGRYAVYVILKLPLTEGNFLPTQLANLLKNLPPGWDVDVDPESLL